MRYCQHEGLRFALEFSHLIYFPDMNLFLASNISSTLTEIFPKAKELATTKKWVFIPTANEVEPEAEAWLAGPRIPLAKSLGFEVEIFTLTGKTPVEVSTALSGAGVICVNGGNNFYLMQQARKSGFDQIIKKLVAEGSIYIGSSAGSMIAGPNFETNLDDRSVTPEMTDFTGLNLTDVAIWPHWNSVDFADAYKKEVDLMRNSNQKTMILNDQQYLHVKDDWYQIVTVA